MLRLGKLFLCGLGLVLLLAGCSVTPPSDPEFQKDMEESLEEWAEDFDADLEEWAARWDGDQDAQKRHYWEIEDSEGAVLYTVEDEEGVKALDDLLSDNDGKSWRRSAEKSSGEPAYSYIYCQEKTLLAGQDPEEERDYEALMQFTVFEEGRGMQLTILDPLEGLPTLPGGVDLSDVLTFSVTVPEETAEALRDPAQFTEE